MNDYMMSSRMMNFRYQKMKIILGAHMTSSKITF